MGLQPERYRLDPALMELTFGDWEGLTWAEIARRDPGGLKRAAGRQVEFRPAAVAKAMRCWPSGCGLGSRPSKAMRSSSRMAATARAMMVLIAGVPPGVAVDTPIVQGRALVFDQGRCKWIG